MAPDREMGPNAPHGPLAEEGSRTHWLPMAVTDFARTVVESTPDRISARFARNGVHVGNMPPSRPRSGPARKNIANAASAVKLSGTTHSSGASLIPPL